MDDVGAEREWAKKKIPSAQVSVTPDQKAQLELARAGARESAAPAAGAGVFSFDSSCIATKTRMIVVMPRMAKPVASCHLPPMSTPALASSVKVRERRKFISSASN